MSERQTFLDYEQTSIFKLKMTTIKLTTIPVTTLAYPEQPCSCHSKPIGPICASFNLSAQGNLEQFEQGSSQLSPPNPTLHILSPTPYLCPKIQAKTRMRVLYISPATCIYQTSFHLSHIQPSSTTQPICLVVPQAVVSVWDIELTKEVCMHKQEQ